MDVFSAIIFENINGDNKFLKIENGKCIIDYIPEEEHFIKTNQNLNIDKIEILNGFGVLLYNNNNIIKEFKKDKIKVKYNDKLKIISIIFFDIYAGFNKFPDIMVYYDENIAKNENMPMYVYENNRYDINEIVYPSNLGMLDEESNRLINFSEIMIMICLKKLKGIKREFTYEEVKAICGFKIVEKVDDKFYIIEKIVKDAEEFNKKFYTTDEFLSNIQEIEEKASYIQEINKEKYESVEELE